MTQDHRYGQSQTLKVFENDLIKLEKAQKALLCTIDDKLKFSNRQIHQEILCLNDGTSIIRRQIVDISTGDTVVTKYYSMAGLEIFPATNQIRNCNSNSPFILETILPEENSNTVTISYMPNLVYPFEVERNGVPAIMGSDYSLTNNVITFTNPFTSSEGAVYSESVKVRYYKS